MVYWAMHGMSHAWQYAALACAVATAAVPAHAEQANGTDMYGIPEWVRTVTGHYVNGTIGEETFVSMAQWLVDRDLLPRKDVDPLDRNIREGVVTRVIDGNTILIDDTRIRIPLIDVVDSGNTTAPHAVLARVLCPAGGTAHYDVDDGQPAGKYGRTIAMVWCSGGISLDRTMVGFGLGWVNTHYCERSEFNHMYDECSG